MLDYEFHTSISCFSSWKYLSNSFPLITVLIPLQLLDSCVKNCPKTFHLEIASRDFEAEYRKLLKKFQSSQPRLADSLKSLLRKWTEFDFKSDPDLSLIPSLYSKLKSEGVDFSVSDFDSVPKVG